MLFMLYKVVINIGLDELRNFVSSCDRCELSKTRTNIVFGVGDPNAEILFIGEGPGQNEDLTGVPFVGRAGQLLDKLLSEINLSREKDIYIANMIKCRPPNNRDPLPNEIENCIGYLRQQFKFIKPKIIVCVGRISAMRIIKSDFKVTREHGIWFVKKNIYIVGTFHPAALLRNPNNLPQARDDLKKLRAKIFEVAPDVYK